MKQDDNHIIQRSFTFFTIMKETRRGNNENLVLRRDSKSNGLVRQTRKERTFRA